MKISKIINFIFALIFIVKIKSYEKDLRELESLKNLNELLENPIELFLPKYDFHKPDKFKSDSYNKVSKYLNEYKRRNDNLKDIYIVPDDIIEENEEKYKRKLIDELIKKEVNLEDSKFDDKYIVYGFPDSLAFDSYKPRLINEESEIKNFDDLGYFITFEPKSLNIIEKPICIPNMSLLNVKNVKDENLILKSVKSDLYQVTVFYFRGKEATHSYNQKSLYPKSIQPGENMIFQIIVLPDLVGDIRGNIYLEFIDNKIIVYPIVIKAVENIYKISPIYSTNWLGSKLLTIPINIFNPHNKILIIKEVVNSFSSVNLVWPNGQPVSSNHTSISTSMLEVQSKTTKNIMQINFYKEVPGVEYGLLQMKTDKDTLIIPVLVRVELQGIKVYPHYFNFGLVDINSNIKQMFPISFSNVYKHPIQIKAVYTLFEDDVIEYISHMSNYICNSKIISSDNLNPEQCVIQPLETINQFGYIMIDPSKAHTFNKKVQGKILIQTNYTDNTFIEINYDYFLDKDIFDTYEISKFNLFYNSSETRHEYKIQSYIKKPYYIPSTDISLDNQLKVYISQSSHLGTHSNKATFKLNLENNNFINKKNYFLAVKTNLDLITILPIKLYDKTLDLHYCDVTLSYTDCLNENYSAYKNINYKSTYLNIDMGIVSTSETGKRYFTIINDNNEDILIQDIDSTSHHILIDLEKIEEVSTHQTIVMPNFNDINLHKNMRKKIITSSKDNISFNIPKNSYMIFSINCVSSYEQDISGTLSIQFEDNVKLTINTIGKFMKGNLNITPSLIRFEPAFPGLFQSKLVSSKSSYNVPVNILSVKSMDQRILPILLTNSIISHNRTEILRIIFDPAKVQLEENFMKSGDFSLNNTNKYLTYRELYLWKEKQRLWESLGSQGRTEINTHVKIKTNIQTELLSVRAFLTKPSLVKKDEIDFGLVQIGESLNKYIEVFNPSDEPMSLQILLASEEFSDIYNNSMFNLNGKINLNNNNELTLIDCFFFNTTNFENSSSNFTQNLISKKERKKRKKEEDENLFSVILEDELNNDNFLKRSVSKNEIVEKLFKNFKITITNAKKIICNSDSLKKNEIILNNNYKELLDQIFSDNFNKEIPIIKMMTEAVLSVNKSSKENSLGMFEKFAYILKILFKTEGVKKKKHDDNKKQEFYLPKTVSSQLYVIKPHQKLKIGPIVYNPSNFSSNSATLFIKNNLTILYPIKLKGDGGSGMVDFYLEDDKDEIHIDKLIINIESMETEVITKNIILKNIGNLPFNINNITLENYGCEAYGIKINNCEGIILKPEENQKISISIKPDFNFYFIEKDLIFENQYQSIKLHISINISNDILSSKNKLFSFENFKNYGYILLLIIVFIGSVISYTLCIEFVEINKKNNNPNSLNFISAKELIDNNPVLKFENLFIKAYRKYNQSFYDDFISKQIDKPGFEMEIREEKRKSKASPEKNLEETYVNNEEKINDNKDINKSKIVIKKNTSKKDKKPITNIKKPIGVPLKANERREEEKKQSIDVQQSSNTPLINKFDTYNIKIENQEINSNSATSDVHWDGSNNYNRNYYYKQYNPTKYEYQHQHQQRNNYYNYAQNPYQYRNNTNINSQINNLNNLKSIDYKPLDKTESKRESFKLNDDKDNSTFQSPSNLKEQFMSFVPDVFEKNKSQENINQGIDNKKDNTDKEIINNFKNFDFTNIFTKNDDNDGQQEEDDKISNKIEEDASSHNYQSEREKIIIEDSGTEEKREEIKFNFNSIFGQNNMKLITPVNINDYTDNEEPKNDLDGNKPYFDKALFFSFDAAFVKPQTNMFNSGSNLFSSNPFSSTNNKKLLSELLDDETNQPEWEEERNKLDDVAENEDEDDEEDPLWGNEEVDGKNDGFFDENGTYKLKQMDFNFDYDFKKL